MKQIIEVILSLTMMVSLTACISNESFRNSSFNKAINKANSSAITFEEKMIGLFNSIFYETVRTATKEAATDSNRLLWDSGYYHALFGDRIANIAYTEFEQMLENEIDELFGSNKVRAWADDGEAMLDGYLEAVFFSEK